jgi:transposase
LKCNHSGNADINAAINILQRFLRGPYGASYKLKEFGKNVQV